MLINTDYVTPADLTGYARAALQDLQRNRFVLSQWLPNRTIDDLVYRFTTGGEGLAEAATFRGYDTESPIAARVGFTRTTGELPPISRKVRLGEYDRLRQRRDASGAIRTMIEDDATRMTRAVAARMEMARGEALYTGKVTLAENGITMTVDFGRTAGHTVTPGTVWTTVATATVLSDLLTWRDTYISTNGEAPGAMITSTRVLGLMMRNAEFRALAATVAGTPSIISNGLVNQVLNSYGLPPVYVNDEQVSVSGTATRVIPDDRLVFAPAPVDPNAFDATDLGATLWGTTAESLEPDFAIEEADQPGIVAGSYSTKDPVAVWTKAAGIGLPVLANPNLTLAADVA